MAELTTIARPYAKAVFAHANATKAQSSWSAFLKKAASVTTDSAMVEVLKNPAVTAETKCGILGDLTGSLGSLWASLGVACNFN